MFGRLLGWYTIHFRPAERPSRWASPHILVGLILTLDISRKCPAVSGYMSVTDVMGHTIDPWPIKLRWPIWPITHRAIVSSAQNMITDCAGLCRFGAIFTTDRQICCSTNLQYVPTISDRIHTVPLKYHSYYTPNSKFGKRAANANRAGRAQRPGVLMPRRWRPGRPILIVDDVISALRNRHVTNRTPLRTSGECKGHTWGRGGTCPQSPKSLKLGTRRHYPCPRAVSTAREYGRHFWHPCPRVSKMAPVFTGRVGHQWLTQVLTRTVFRGSPKWRPSSRAVDTDREHRCHFLTPVSTGRGHG